MTVEAICGWLGLSRQAWYQQRRRRQRQVDRTATVLTEAFNCRPRTVEKLQERLVVDGFDLALNGKKRETPPTPRKLDGVGEAKLIALRLGPPPPGYGRWSLKLLADQLVTLEIVENICPETVRQTLKKTE
ncbi:MAG: hypothetical protein FOGNACKC_04849 [Anaerolineae bacterium]|nr:hypothetical protein [Anaerolineae bacterium]